MAPSQGSDEEDVETLQEMVDPFYLQTTLNETPYHFPHNGNEDGDSGYASDDERQNTTHAVDSSYENMTSSGQSFQINGDIRHDEHTQSFRMVCHWNNGRSSGSSRQVNGNVHDSDFAAAFFS